MGWKDGKDEVKRVGESRQLFDEYTLEKMESDGRFTSEGLKAWNVETLFLLNNMPTEKNCTLV